MDRVDCGDAAADFGWHSLGRFFGLLRHGLECRVVFFTNCVNVFGPAVKPANSDHFANFFMVLGEYSERTGGTGAFAYEDNGLALEFFDRSYDAIAFLLPCFSLIAPIHRHDTDVSVLSPSAQEKSPQWIETVAKSGNVYIVNHAISAF